MKFQDKLSRKQAQGIFFLIVGIIFLVIKFTPSKSVELVKAIGLLFIIIGIMDFIEESIRRYKIINPFNTNIFDSKAEERIADYFKRKNIIFHHHPQIKVPKPFFGFLTIPFVNLRLEPDFFLPEFNVFVEYWD